VRDRVTPNRPTPTGEASVESRACPNCVRPCVAVHLHRRPNLTSSTHPSTSPIAHFRAHPSGFRRAIVRGIERASRGLNTESNQATTRCIATAFLGDAGRARTDDYQLMSEAIIRSRVPIYARNPLVCNVFSPHLAQLGSWIVPLSLGETGESRSTCRPLEGHLSSGSAPG
jgi:hypothetical protein